MGRVGGKSGARAFYGRIAAAAAILVILLIRTVSYAWVNVTYPNNDALLSGTVVIKASVTGDYWSQLVVDGKAVRSTSNGAVSFTWNTATVADGAHWVTVKGYGKSQSVADSSESVSVSVLNHANLDHSIRFGTKTESAPLPSGAWCAQVIPFETEMVPANARRNSTVPTTAQLNSYASNGYNANPYSGTWAYARANGQYTGTTDMIIRWAACKWGIDEDVVRAQTTTEHWSWDQTTAHGDKRTSISQCVNGSFAVLWNYQCSNCCYQTWSNWQTKVYYDWQTWPMIDTSTAFAADYRYADQRACMNGDLADYFNDRPSYNGHSYARDIAGGNLDTILWGCIGTHYSGDWYDGDSQNGAIWYINFVKGVLARKDWKAHWPSIAWPD